MVNLCFLPVGRRSRRRRRRRPGPGWRARPGEEREDARARQQKAPEGKRRRENDGARRGGGAREKGEPQVRRRPVSETWRWQVYKASLLQQHLFVVMQRDNLLRALLYCVRQIEAINCSELFFCSMNSGRRGNVQAQGDFFTALVVQNIPSAFMTSINIKGSQTHEKDVSVHVLSCIELISKHHEHKDRSSDSCDLQTLTHRLKTVINVY